MRHQSDFIVLNSSEIERLLTMDVCIDLMAEALSGLTRDELHQPLRMIIKPRDSAKAMALMPAYRQNPQVLFGLKAICVFPENPAKGMDGHQGAVILFSPETGELNAILNGSSITAIRTAAASALATRLLARDDASDLTIIGAGVQARTHLEAIACVRSLRRVRVVSRNTEDARKFVAENSRRYPFPIEAVAETEHALAGADLIVTCTTASEPVLRREWIAGGAHINAVGACFPTTREIDSATMAAARLFVDRRESALNEAGDYLIAVSEGAISESHIEAEIGELLTGAKTGRRSADEITLFKSLGLAVEDLVCAEYLFRKAKEDGIGTSVPF